MSSATVARCGRHSEIAWPLSPCWANLRCVPSSLASPLMKANRLLGDERLGDRLAVELLQLRLVVEQLELARPAGHEQVDDALRPRGVMRRTGGERIDVFVAPWCSISPGQQRPRPCAPRPTRHCWKKWRRAARSAECESAKCGMSVHGIHSRVMVSSRFNSTRQIASRPAVGSLGRLAAISCSNQWDKQLAFGGGRLRGSTDRNADSARRRSFGGSSASTRWASACGTFEKRLIVGERQRLQRRVAAQPAGAGDVAAGGVEREQHRIRTGPPKVRVHAAAIAIATVAAFQGLGSCVKSKTPSGCGGKTLGPPIVRVSRPAAVSAASRTISASRRRRDCRASNRFADRGLSDRCACSDD